MVNDGTLHYDHDKDGTHTELAGCESSFRNKDYSTYLAVRYQNNRLTVSVDADNQNQWKECFSVDRVHLPTQYYFGFGSATGDLSDNHDIISVKTYQLTSDKKLIPGLDYSRIIPKAETAPHDREHTDDDKQSSGAWTFFKYLFSTIFILVLVIGGVIGGYLYYTKQQREKKRFY
jgi:lectin, mannose-binding 2